MSSSNDNFMNRYLDPLESLRHLNISRLYDDFSQVIDLVIFFMLFYGLAHVTLGKKFEGRGGNLISIAVGSALAISTLLLERTMGFSLKSFGGVAIFVILGIVSVLLYMTLRSLEVSRQMSFCVTYLAVFFGFNAVSPEMFVWFIERFPTIHLILLFVFFAAVILSAIKLIRLFSGGRSLPGIKTDMVDGQGMIDAPGRRELKEERNAAKELRHETIEELHEAKEIIHILQTIIKALEQDGITAKNKPAIQRGVEGILKAEHEIESQLKHQNEQLLSLQSATDLEIKSAVEEFRKRESIAIKHLKDFRYQLQEGVSALQNNNTAQAITHFDSARAYERKLRSMLKALKQQENRILKIVKKDERKAKNQKRQI